MPTLPRLALLAAALVAATPALAEKPRTPQAPVAGTAGLPHPQPVYLGFAPPPDGVVAYRVVQRTNVTLGSESKGTAWSHVVELRIGARRSSDLIDAVATLRDIRFISGEVDEPFHLIARAIEGRPFRVTLLEGVGAPMATDWSTLRPAIAAGLSRHMRPGVGRAVAEGLRAFDVDEGTPAVLGPLLTGSIAHLLPYASDGSVRSLGPYDGPSAYRIAGRSIETSGRALAGSPATVAFKWRVHLDPRVGAPALAAHMGNAVRAALASSDGGGIRGASASLGAGSVELSEWGEAEVEPGIGLLRRVRHEASVVGPGLRKETVLEMERIRP